MEYFICKCVIYIVTCNFDFNVEALLANNVLDINSVDARVGPF